MLVVVLVVDPSQGCRAHRRGHVCGDARIVQCFAFPRVKLVAFRCFRHSYPVAIKEADLKLAAKCIAKHHRVAMFKRRHCFLPVHHDHRLGLDFCLDE